MYTCSVLCMHRFVIPVTRRLWRRMTSPRVFPVVATVPTGLERGAAEECREVLAREATAQRGSITCTLEAVEELSKVY